MSITRHLLLSHSLAEAMLWGKTFSGWIKKLCMIWVLTSEVGKIESVEEVDAQVGGSME